MLAALEGAHAQRELLPIKGEGKLRVLSGVRREGAGSRTGLLIWLRSASKDSVKTLDSGFDSMPM